MISGHGNRGARLCYHYGYRYVITRRMCDPTCLADFEIALELVRGGITVTDGLDLGFELLTVDVGW